MVTRVNDLSVDELKTLIQDTVTQTLLELLRDPDEGLELREDFVNALKYSLETSGTGPGAIAVEDVATRLGLHW